MDYLAYISTIISITSTITTAIAAGLIKYALQTNERLARLEVCIRAIKRDVEEIKGDYRSLDNNLDNTKNRLTKIEERLNSIRR